MTEDDGEATVDVGACDLFESVGARQVRRRGERNIGRSFAILSNRRVGDVVPREISAAEEVQRSPRNLLELSGSVPSTGSGHALETDNVVVGNARSRPTFESRKTFRSTSRRILRRLTGHAGVEGFRDFL